MLGMNGSWLRQPTTMIGLAVCAGVAVLLALGKIDAGLALAVVPGVLFLLGLNDNTDSGQAAKTLAIDAIKVATEGHLTENLPRLINEAVNAATRLKGMGPLLAFSLLAGCTLTPDQKAALAAGGRTIACRADVALQPVTAEIVKALIPGAAAGITLDEIAVHPAIVRYCASLGGVPVNPAAAAPVVADPIPLPGPPPAPPGAPPRVAAVTRPKG